jgi:hypothetical protein
MLNFIKRMITLNPKGTMFYDKNVADKVTEVSQDNVATFVQQNNIVLKQDRCTFEYNVQYRTLRHITRLFQDVLHNTTLLENQRDSVVLCLSTAQKDCKFIKNRLHEGTYDKTKGTDYDEHTIELYSSLKVLRVLKNSLFYIYENKSNKFNQKSIVSKLINIVKNEINTRQSELDSLKKENNIVGNK